MDPVSSSTQKSRLRSFLERHTKTDLGYLGSGGFWLTIDQLAPGFISFLLIIGFAHFVSAEAYGNYRYLLAALWTLTAFTLTGLPTAVAQAVARGHEGAFRKAFRWSILGGLPLTVIGLGASAYYYFSGNMLLACGFLAIAVLGPLMQPSYLFGSFLTGKKDFRAMALLGTAFSAVPALGLGIAMLVTQNPLALFLTYLGGTVVGGLSFYALTLSWYRPNASVNKDLRSLVGHFSAMNVLTTVAAQVDKLVVFHFLGAVELAIYTFATAIPEQMRGVFGGVSTLALPKFANRTRAEVEENFWTRLWGFTGLLGVASLAYILIAPLFFSLFLPAYMSAVGYSQLFALSLIMTSAAIPNALLQAHAAKRELYALNIATPIFQILILVTLTIVYGLIGTIIARIAARAFTLIASAYLVRLYLRKGEPA